MLAADGGRALAQDASPAMLKAAFLFNFVRFAEWPGDAARPGAPIVLCVVGDADVAAALESIVRKGRDNGPARVVMQVDRDGAVEGCHLLYVSGGDAERARTLAQSLHGAPTLTVSDLPNFARAAGVINFFVEDEKMRFVINTDAADRSRLRFSSKLLSLAKIVRDEPGPIRR
jgi:hypothetical protein